jgi:hypothetical protein
VPALVRRGVAFHLKLTELHALSHRAWRRLEFPARATARWLFNATHAEDFIEA